MQKKRVLHALNTLKESPLKITFQRKKLIEILFSKGDAHFTVEEVYKKVKKEGLKVSLATVYNSLNQFTKHGILKIVKAPKEKFFFDTNMTPHHHFFCKSSGELSDIELSDIKIKKIPSPPNGKKISSVEIFVNIQD